MSWWETGNGDDVIGDQPADIVRRSLKKAAEARSDRGMAKPALIDLLRAIGMVARGSGDLLAGRPDSLQRVVAVLKSGDTIESAEFADDPAGRDLVAAIAQGLRETAAVYRERWERNPRLSEWLEAFSFVLRVRPEEFLRDGAEHVPSGIRAE